MNGTQEVRIDGRTRRTPAEGDVVRIEVSEIGPSGVGLARQGAHRFRIPGGLSGDVVEARVVRRGRGYAEVRMERLLQAGIGRIEPRCSHFSVCGGCAWQDVPYEEQVCLKKAIVLGCLRRRGLDGVEVGDVVGSEEVFFYRNKMDFSFGNAPEGRLVLGLFADAAQAGSARLAEVSDGRGGIPPVFDLDACWLQSEASNRIVTGVREVLRGTRAKAYHPDTRSGVLRSLVLREGKRTGEMLINLVLASSKTLQDSGLRDELIRAAGGVKGFVLSVNRKRSRHAAPKSEEVLVGVGRILERILGLEVEVSPTSFLQVNTLGAERLYECALDYAGLTGTERVLDLYCGAGVFSLLLAHRAVRVTGVEIVNRAVEDAHRNAERNGIANCGFVCADVLDTLPELVAGGEVFEVVTLNPPRTGVPKPVIDAVCSLRPGRVVYVSCSPETLARDLALFAHSGLRAEHVQPVDLFPHTPHCEVVAKLSPMVG